MITTTNKIIKEEHTVGVIVLPMRFDQYAALHLENIPTKKSAYKLIKKGVLLLNGNHVSPEHRIVEGDCLSLFEHLVKKPVFNLKLTVHHEDEVCAVIEKLPGFPVMGNFYKTIENALPFNLKESQERDKLLYPKPVHRLDSPTGGLLLIAKTASALSALSHQFQMRKVKKQYSAIVSGKVPLHGEIKTPIEGRDAHTVYQRIDYVNSLHTEWISIIKIDLLTGRTHQIRKHMASIGHPVIGDEMYAINGTFRGKGLFLWSTLLEFKHPKTDDVICITISPPPKFSNYMKREEKRWKRNEKSEK